MRNGIVLRIENTSRIGYDAPLNAYSERPPASSHVLHVFVSAKSAHVGTSVRVHPCHRTPQALDEVLARFHLQGRRRKQQTVLKEVPDALDGVEIWCELWMLTDGGRACRTYVRTRRMTAI